MPEAKLDEPYKKRISHEITGGLTQTDRFSQTGQIYIFQYLSAAGLTISVSFASR